MLVALIQQLEKDLQEFYQLDINKNTDDINIPDFKEWVLKLFGEKAPVKEYTNFITNVNGVNYNGLYLYGIKPTDYSLDIMYNNDAWHEIEIQKNICFLDMTIYHSMFGTKKVRNFN
ncbi:YrhA family protein [Listeria seeligeri]|uniref:YrhA family protein n=1 Tax=Listeria seeligeri TaxID=1640 RepID=UPI00188900AA|nr:YrhA family protein [Listeria seeligeri]MBF2458546.1 hypothetical protein [Listeria seeligeri]MBF2549725.1 hypothetical protein [Listeria seeligeri]MBF2563308.1 hypothetical protein [Listeria seeligeri]